MRKSLWNWMDFAAGPITTWGFALVVVLCFAIVTARIAHASGDTVPIPTVRPSPQGVHGFPFGSTVVDLSAVGFVETEYLMSGTATAYVRAAPFGAQGQWEATPNPGVSADYTTRLLVRRPTNPKDFNGIVIVEWLNVSAGFDTSAEWAYAHDELIKGGFAFVGVTAQYVGALGLQKWEAGEKGDRYKSIFHPGDSFSYDIFSQAASAIRNASVQPLGNLTSHIQKVVGHGYSQSAFALFTYVNAINPLAGVYDGFLIESSGFGLPLSVRGGSLEGGIPAPSGVPATPYVSVPFPAYVRDDQASPVLMVAGEFDEEYLGVGQAIHGEADSDHFHLWEIAGMAHFDPITQNLPDIKKSLPGTQNGFTACTYPPPNSGIPAAYAMRAATYQIGEWARSGVPPRPAQRLEVTSNANDFFFVRRNSATGIAIGGVRFPVVDVPIGTMSGNRMPNANCFPEAGAYDPWDHDTDPWDGQPGVDPSPTPEPVLLDLYPTHRDYVQQVSDSALNSVSEGVMRPEDAIEAIAEATSAKVP